MSAGLPTRPLGKTGVNVSVLCLGGWHVGQPQLGDDEPVRLMHAAIDEGITFFDNAWDYHDGRSEELMGRALSTGGRREKVFLMSKNCARDAAGTRQHLEDSLRRLKTDHLDLWQFHEVNYDNDPDWIASSGALDVALKAKDEGKVRFLGFTGHKSPHILAKMLPLTDAWDTCQVPVNVLDHFYRSFRHDLIPELIARGIGPIGMKSLGGGNVKDGAVFVANKVCSPSEAIRYALTQPVCSLVVGVDSAAVLRQNVGIARDFSPLVGPELDALLARVKAVAGDGRFEGFKSTQVFDGPYHRQQHGFAVA
jgi:predicted aldo/keto reductase-like oxidoreductase